MQNWPIRRVQAPTATVLRSVDLAHPEPDKLGLIYTTLSLSSFQCRHTFAIPKPDQCDSSRGNCVGGTVEPLFENLSAGGVRRPGRPGGAACGPDPGAKIGRTGLHGAASSDRHVKQVPCAAGCVVLAHKAARTSKGINLSVE